MRGNDRAALHAELARELAAVSRAAASDATDAPSGAEACPRAVAGAGAGDGAEGATTAAALEEALVDVVCAVLEQEPLLARLAAVQRLGQVGSEGARRCHARAVALLGEEAAHRSIESHVRAGAGAELPGEVRSDRLAGDEVPETSDASAAGVGAGTDELATASAARCVATVADWLLALTASDVSVMIALEVLDDAADEACDVSGGCWAQAEDSRRPGVARTRGGVRVAYRVAVVDVQPKPVTKVREHAERDARLVEDAAGRGGVNAAATGAVRGCEERAAMAVS